MYKYWVIYSTLLVISWWPVFIGSGSWSDFREPLTFSRKAGNPYKLRSELKVPAKLWGFELTNIS